MKTTLDKNRLRQQLDEAREDFRTLRDEVRLQVHLASMDLKDEWEKLQPRLQEVEKVWDIISDTALETTQEVRKRLLDFKDQLKALSHQRSTRPH